MKFNISLFFILTSLFITGCSSFTHKRSNFQNSALSNLNPAPVSMSPKLVDGQIVDTAYVQTQADYHFSLAEAYSFAGRTEKAIDAYRLTLVYDPDSVTVRVRLISEYIRQGLYTEAIEQAQLAIKTDPNSIDAHMLLGTIYANLKMYVESIAQYEQILKLDKNNEDATLLLSSVYIEQGNFAKAEKLLKSVIEQSDKSPKLYKYHFYLAQYYQEEGKQHFANAEVHYTKSLNLKPNKPETALGLARLYDEWGKSTQAMKMLESFHNRFGPDHSISHFLSRRYMQSETFDKAIVHLQVMEEYEPSNLNLKLKIGLILIEQKKLTEALARFKQILRQVPDSDKVLYYTALVHKELNNPKEAIDYFSKIGPVSTYYVESVIHKSYLHKDLAENSEALETVEKAIANRDDVPQFYALYASILDEEKQYQKSLKLLTKAEKKFPQNTQILFFLGTTHDKVGKREKTLQYMQKVISVDNEHVQALNYLAYTYAELGLELEYAEQLASKALRLQPDDGYIMDTLGWVLFKQGRTKEAITYLEAAYKINSEESIIAEHLGDAYYKFQLTEKAKQMYTRAAKVETDEKKSNQILQKLSEISNPLQSNPKRLPASNNQK